MRKATVAMSIILVLALIFFGQAAGVIINLIAIGMFFASWRKVDRTEFGTLAYVAGAWFLQSKFTKVVSIAWVVLPAFLGWKHMVMTSIFMVTPLILFHNWHAIKLFVHRDFSLDRHGNLRYKNHVMEKAVTEKVAAKYCTVGRYASKV